MASELRLGIIGLGRAAAALLPSLKAHPGIKIVAAADVLPDARARFSEVFGGPAYENAKSLCQSADIDAVYIATPHQCHVNDALTAAAFGKHMIIEKPMALSLQECRRIVDAAAEANVVTLVGHTHGFDPAVRKMRETIASGTVGALRMITSIAYTDFLYRPRRPEELDSALGGGIMYNQVPHQIEIARVLANDSIRSVRAVSGIWDKTRRTEGAMSALMEFTGGTTASLIYSGYDHFDTDEWHNWIGAGGRKKVPAQGSARRKLESVDRSQEAKLKAESGFGGGKQQNGTAESAHQPHFGLLLVSCDKADMRTSADGITIYDDNGIREIPLPPGRAVPNRDQVADDFYDAVVNGRKPRHDALWGQETVATALALVSSAAKRQEIFMDDFKRSAMSSTP